MIGMRGKQPTTPTYATQKIGWSIFAFAVTLCASAISAGSAKRSAQWTRYANARWGFCVDYPASWKASEQADGSGVNLYPHPAEKSSGAAYISISGVPDQPDIDNANVVLDDSPPLDLEENLMRVLGNLREYDHASDIRVIDKRKLTFQSYQALSTKYQYRSGPGATPWLSDTLWINKEYVIFTASLLGRPEEVRELEPEYQEIVKHRFQLVCGGTR
jgi:hypothetical protein